MGDRLKQVGRCPRRPRTGKQRWGGRPSGWSTNGHSDPTLPYRLLKHMGLHLDQLRAVSTESDCTKRREPDLMAGWRLTYGLAVRIRGREWSGFMSLGADTLELRSAVPAE